MPAERLQSMGLQGNEGIEVYKGQKILQIESLLGEPLEIFLQRLYVEQSVNQRETLYRIREKVNGEIGLTLREVRVWIDLFQISRGIGQGGRKMARPGPRRK